MTALYPLAQVRPELVEALLDRVFGEDRHNRTAYKVRAGSTQLDALSFAALDNNEYLVGSIQCWPVKLSADNGDEFPMIMVGPVAVDPEHQNMGIGRALMTAMLEAMSANAPLPLVMIGDPEYYGRHFAFSAKRTQQWELPGPFERERLLIKTIKGLKLPEVASLAPWLHGGGA
ncbi:MAG: N-acetyltransferase [Pseudomonadota bacterium]